jgi:hypothetical protein
MSRRIRENRIKYREDIVEGLENAPRAFLKLFRSENFGKLLVNLKIKNELVYTVFQHFPIKYIKAFLPTPWLFLGSVPILDKKCIHLS